MIEPDRRADAPHAERDDARSKGRDDRVRVPRATYRLQLHAGFRLRDAIEIVPYLADLGISHVYCSPYLRARPGSSHGYDIVDHRTLNPEIGSRDELETFVACLHEHGMGQVMDVVPNHMGIMGADNAWWLDVLENGQASLYADFFDIDWHPADPDLENRVLIPVLGGHYGEVLARGELVLGFDGAASQFAVRYFDHLFPIDPREYPRILALALGAASMAAIPSDALAELRSLITAFGNLPHRDATESREMHERGTRTRTLKGRLAALVASQAAVANAVQGALLSFNGEAGVATSFDLLHDLLESQAYRLAFWRVASDEINYRRFFDINELAALRMESEAVFEETHALIFELVAAGLVDALRIDHPDGLYDPAAYFRRLQDRLRSLTPAGRGVYVSVEKIIAPFENMPESWAVSGTTGYRYANVVNGLFVDSAAESRFTRLYRAFVGDQSSFAEIAQRSKFVILRDALASELTVLSNRLMRIARADRRTRDYTLNTLRRALSEVIAVFPVYRTYIADEVSADDRRYIEWAVGLARKASRAADTGIFDFIKSSMLAESSDPALLASVNRFARKVQQLTAPVMAKGVEDTSFYIYNRLVSLNDVGGDPATFGYGVNAFHGASADRAAKWPHTMLATSTHDNKRSEDVRARIDVLSEMPDAWQKSLRRWGRLNLAKKREVDGELAPSRNDEYLLYQTLIGSFPCGEAGAGLAAYRERIGRYMLKAVREAKVHTSWISNNTGYEAAVLHFVEDLLVDLPRNVFLKELRAMAREVAWFGRLNSLSMTLLKLTSPGVPDIYQGNEIRDFSLADPDNRRLVDFALRRRLLTQVESADFAAAIANPGDGGDKLFVIRNLLALRSRLPALFLEGGYTPLQAVGEKSSHVVAYARRHEGCSLVAAAGRLFVSLGASPGAMPDAALWGDARIEIPFLAEGTALRDVLSGKLVRVRAGGVALAEVFGTACVAALVHDGATSARH
ncbi:MAG TPA: malto-oligosyltrehalose synthase [Burkholderiales bacterium]|nr:malto-oligosyltrehalose synthase [Burkholderiales bacterium]